MKQKGFWTEGRRRSILIVFLLLPVSCSTHRVSPSQDLCFLIDYLLYNRQKGLRSESCLDKNIILSWAKIGEEIHREIGSYDFFRICYLISVSNLVNRRQLDYDPSIFEALYEPNDLARRIALTLMGDQLGKGRAIPYRILIDLVVDPRLPVTEREDLIGLIYDWYPFSDFEPVLWWLTNETDPGIINQAAGYLVVGLDSSEDDADRLPRFLEDENPYIRARAICNAPWAASEDNGEQIRSKKELLFQLTMNFLSNPDLPLLARKEVISSAGDMYSFLDEDPMILKTLFELLERDYFQWGERPSEHSVTTALTTLGGILEQPEYCALWHKTLNRLEQNPDLVPMVKEIRLYWDRVGCEEPLRE